MLWTCDTPGCEVCGHFTDEPGHCSICLRDLVGVYDATGELHARMTPSDITFAQVVCCLLDDELRQVLKEKRA